jgi:pectate lyase
MGKIIVLSWALGAMLVSGLKAGTGIEGTGSFKLSYTSFGNGTVDGATDGQLIDSGSTVILTALPADGETFGGWRGDTASSEAQLSFKMNSPKNLKAIFLTKGAYAKTDEKIGWAFYKYDVTGGEGGTEVTVTNQADLESHINKSGKYIIKIQGTIHVSPIGKKMTVGSDKTIIGIGTDATIKGGGFKIGNAQNVIIQYLTFKDAFVDWDGKTTDNDAIEINNSKHVWVDHCDLSHYDDGLIDIKNGSDFVTVSWCHFHNHNKTMLIGASNDAPQDVGHLNVTVHHCWFNGEGGNGIARRLPMVRFGMVHVFNNYYNDVANICVEANYDANVVVDNNYFIRCNIPHALVGGAGDNKMNSSGNIYISSNSRRNSNGKAFNPADYYEYEYNKTADVPALVMLGAGVNYLTEIGEEDTVTVGKANLSMPKGFYLGQNYPNPFHGETTLPFSLGKDAMVHVDNI